MSGRAQEFGEARDQGSAAGVLEDLVEGDDLVAFRISAGLGVDAAGGLIEGRDVAKGEGDPCPLRPLSRRPRCSAGAYGRGGLR